MEKYQCVNTMSRKRWFLLGYLFKLIKQTEYEFYFEKEPSKYHPNIYCPVKDTPLLKYSFNQDTFIKIFNLLTKYNTIKYKADISKICTDIATCCNNKEELDPPEAEFCFYVGYNSFLN